MSDRREAERRKEVATGMTRKRGETHTEIVQDASKVVGGAGVQNLLLMVSTGPGIHRYHWQQYPTQHQHGKQISDFAFRWATLDTSTSFN
jgi:hypothetical protein